MEPRKQAKIAFLLSLWPFLLFLSFLGLLYIIIIASAVSPASSGGTVREAIGIFVLQAVISPAMAAPLVSIMIGFIMGIVIGGSGVDRRTMRRATMAAILAFPSLLVYAYLLFAVSGIGR